MKRINKKEIVIGIIIKTIAILASVYGLVLSMKDVMSLTYFTNLSNILIDFISGVFLVSDIIKLKSNGSVDLKTNALYIVKFLFTISITLTFLVYLLILAPTAEDGILSAYFSDGGGSFCVHFLGPVLAIIDFIFFDYEYESVTKHAFYGIIPPLCYVGFIVVLGTFGVRWSGKMYAPYNFINYGAKTGWFGFDLSQIGGESLGIGVFYMIIILVLIFLGIGRVYLMLKNLRKKKINDCSDNT